MKISEIVPVIANGITFLFGQLFWIPLTKLIIAMIKHGMKTNNIKHAITTSMNIKSHPTKKIPINAMPILYVFYVLIATILEIKSHYFVT